MEQTLENAERAVKNGFTVVRLMPLPGSEKLGYSELMKSMVGLIMTMRETVGDKVDICIDIHNRFTPMEAITFCRETEKHMLFFVEDPIMQESAERMANVTSNTIVPIATGERLHNIFEFREFLQWKRAHCKIVRPDLCLCGGLIQGKKIVALAEAFQTWTVPHNPLGPVSTAACVQLDACIPNALVQEYIGEGSALREDFKMAVKSPVKLEKGYLIVPETPGIGVEMDEDAVIEGMKTYKMREIHPPMRADGSVADI